MLTEMFRLHAVYLPIT